MAEAKRESFRGALTWRQGALGKDKKDVYIAIKEPYRGPEDVAYFIGQTPPGAIVVSGAKKAARTIQQITGKAPGKLLIDMGIMDIKIEKPTQSPGTKGAIAFTRDLDEKTTGTITIGAGKGSAPSLLDKMSLRRGPEHTSDISLRRHPQDTKEAHAAAAAEAAAITAAKTKVDVTKVRARARAEQRGKPMTRETSPLVRRIQSAGGRTLLVSNEAPASNGAEVVSTTKSGKQRIDLVKMRESKGSRSTTPLVRNPKAPPEMTFGKEGPIYTATESASGVKMYSRRRFKQRLT